MIPFTVGALGCAALLGLGNGAVFKLVPQYFPDADRHGHRPGRRDGRTRRLLPAAAARLLPRPHRRRLAGLRAARRRRRSALWWANHRVFVPRQQALDLALPAEPAPHRRPPARRRLGHAVDRAAGRRHRGRLAQSAELRSGAGDLHLRRHLRHLGRRLPLQRLAATSRRRASIGSAAGNCSGAEASLRSLLRMSLASAVTHLVGADASSPSARGCAGGCTSSSSGAACWPSPSPSRWSSAGFTSARCPTTR